MQRSGERDIDHERLGRSGQSLVTALAALGRLLGVPERDVERRVQVFFDPVLTSIDFHRHGYAAIEIIGTDGAAKPIFAVVRARDAIVDLVVAQHRQHRSELLLLYQARIIGQVAHDGERDQVSITEAACRPR